MVTIFLLDGFRIVDQTRAPQELLAHGGPVPLMLFLMIAGRLVSGGLW
jgi:hypothetical protein